MLIDGLNGGSLDKQHKGWFEISGVDLDMEKLAAGDFASLNVTMPGGVELADVMKMAATGGDLTGHGVIRGVHIEGFTAGMNPVKVYDLTLANVAVSDVAVTNAADSESLGTACPSTTARSRWSPTASMAAASQSRTASSATTSPTTPRSPRSRLA